MINVLDSVKQLYKSDSVMKKYFLVFRDYGQMLDNTRIVGESLQITESICSSGNFKVGLCESASSKISAVLDDNIKNDEMCIFQVLGDFEPTITNPPIERDSANSLVAFSDTNGIQLSGEGVTKLTTSFTSSNIISGLDSNNFTKEEDYLVLAKLKYIGNPIYLYVETSAGTSRMVYYLKGEMFNFVNLPTWASGQSYDESETVLHNGFVWQSRTQNNTIEPAVNVNSWKNITRYIQIAIPIVGSEFYEYKKGIYVNTESGYGTLEGTASIYKLNYPIMPLGLYTVKGCKRTNDRRIRDLECYDRMMDVGLDVECIFSGSSNIQMGQVLDQAAQGTQIVIGNNLSKEQINPDLISEETVSFTNFPTGNIYQTTKDEAIEVQGTYSESQSGNTSLDYTRTEQKTLAGTYVNSNNGAYSHTQMQIIDGYLDETANNNNKEFSTTLRKTIQSNKLIDSDNGDWNTYKDANKLRVIGTRRQTKAYKGSLLDSDNSNWTTYNNAGTLRIIGTRRQSQKFSGTIIDSDNSNWTQANKDAGKLYVRPSTYRRQTTTKTDKKITKQDKYWICSGYVDVYRAKAGTGGDDWEWEFDHKENFSNVRYEYYPTHHWEETASEGRDYFYNSCVEHTDTTVIQDWTYKSGSTITYGGKTYTYLSSNVTEGTWTNWNSVNDRTRTDTAVVTFYRDTSVGWYFSSYTSKWIKEHADPYGNPGEAEATDFICYTSAGTRIRLYKTTYWNTHYDTSYGYNYSGWDKTAWPLLDSEYYTGIADSSWVNTSGQKIKNGAYINVYRDTSYGYVYDNLPGWSIQTSEYYTGIADSDWLTSGGAKIKKSAYINLYKTLYWKYNWDSLTAKGTGDNDWVAYGTGTTFQYQSQSSASGNQYKLASERPAQNNWYTQLNTIYSDAAVYKKMSRRYTRLHKYDYTFANAGTGWTKYKNSQADDSYNYVKDTSAANKQYIGVTLADQRKVGMYSDKIVYNSLARDYRRQVKYGYTYITPEGGHWLHPNADYNVSGDRLKYKANSTIDSITYLNDVYETKWRQYSRTIIHTWEETAVLKKMTYEIPSAVWDSSMAYTVYIQYPSDGIAYQREDEVRQLALKDVGDFTDSEINYTAHGTLNTDRQSAIRASILEDSTKVAMVGNDRKFYVYWVYSLTYTGYTAYNDEQRVDDAGISGTIYAANPYQSCVMHSTAEKFNSMQIQYGSDAIQGTRRAIISGFMEIHGLFINFDRWGVSTTRNVSASTLYPAENLYPHDSTIPGYEAYGDIYPSVGSTEVTDVSICKSIYIDDDLNNEFDGVCIIKSNVSASETSLYPFYYNRQNKRYGALPHGMPEVGHVPWEGNNYYKIENNFFFDNFIFTETQLKDICKQILANVGSLQYFNLTAELRALPYMEVGDSIDIMTPQNGYETAILRRVMKGNIAMMDSIETDFY